MPFVEAIKRARTQRTKSAAPVIPDRIKQLDLEGLIGRQEAGDECFPQREAWQLAVLVQCVVPLVDDDGGAGFTTKAAYEVAKPHLAKGWPHWVPEDMRPLVTEQIPGYRNPFDIVKSYLDYLETCHVIERSGSHWDSTSAFARSAREIDRLESERAERHVTIRDMVREILKMVPPTVRRGFSYETWLRNALFPYATIEEAINAVPDDEFDKYGRSQTYEYRHLHAQISALFRMTCENGPVVEYNVFLPLGSIAQDIARDRQAKAEQLRLSRLAAEQQRLEAEQAAARVQAEAARLAAESRLDRLRSYLNRHFDSDRSADVYAKLKVHGRSARELAFGSEAGLEQVVDYLEGVGGRKVQPPEAIRKASQWRNTLRLVFPTTNAVVWEFLNTWNPAYGGKPIDTCVGSSSYEELKTAVLAVMKGRLC